MIINKIHTYIYYNNRFWNICKQYPHPPTDFPIWERSLGPPDLKSWIRPWISSSSRKYDPLTLKYIYIYIYIYTIIIVFEIYVNNIHTHPPTFQSGRGRWSHLTWNPGSALEYHHQVRSMTHLPLFTIRSWNNVICRYVFRFLLTDRNTSTVCRWRYLLLVMLQI